MVDAQNWNAVHYTSQTKIELELGAAQNTIQ